MTGKEALNKLEEGFTMEQLLETPPHVKNNQLQVSLPTQHQQGAVYIGRGGLRGGGPSASSLRGGDPLSN